jgi:succinate dehydrogenase flavin-adding protein (antitoxin of CptAB toxin-antitoxin module)
MTTGGTASHCKTIRDKNRMRWAARDGCRYGDLIDRVVSVSRMVSSSIAWRCWARTMLSEFTGDLLDAINEGESGKSRTGWGRAG